MPSSHPLNLVRLLTDHGIEFTQSDNGWINTFCPFCYKGDGVKGLGFNRSFSCFRCGRLGTWETIAKLLSISLKEAALECRKYGQKGSLDRREQAHQNNAPGAILGLRKRLSLPYGSAPMTAKHRNYLISRNFDPEQLESEWGLLGTGHLGDYAHRIIIPIYDEDSRLVCFQGRDITDKASSKYKSCSDDKAVESIKTCLYGIHKCQGNSWVIITEGVTKVWRLGPGSVATFGAKVTYEQILQLKKFKKRIILFDNDEAGRAGAEDLAHHLSLFPEDTITIFLDTIADPADMSPSEVKELLDLCRQGII